jgi:hypothetical protein
LTPVAVVPEQKDSAVKVSEVVRPSQLTHDAGVRKAIAVVDRDKPSMPKRRAAS